MKFTLTANLATPTAEEITEYVFEHLKENFNLAVRKFFETLLSRIPVRTGFLAGSFYPAAQFFGASPFYGQAFTRKGRVGTAAYQTKLRRFTGKYERTFKITTPEELAAGKKRKYQVTISRADKVKGKSNPAGGNEYYYPNRGPAGKILKTLSSGIPFTTTHIEVEKDHLRFDISTLIKYYQINDLSSRGRGTPWQSMQTARLRLIEEVKKIADKIDIVKGIRTWTQIKLLNGSVYTSKGPKQG